MLEVLEDRTVPYINAYRTGELLVSPPAAPEVPAPIETDINRQLVNVALPTGEAFPTHGLKKADAETTVVNWKPT
jgi:hypothetical protein